MRRCAAISNLSKGANAAFHPAHGYTIVMAVHPERFRRLAHRTAHHVGSPWAFGLALLIIAAWGITGPLFHFSDTWQLVINTGTTIVTFLMVFLIQNTQNRDSLAIQLKLAELIIAVEGAHNKLADCEELSEEELEKLHADYHKQASIAEQELESRR